MPKGGFNKDFKCLKLGECQWYQSGIYLQIIMYVHVFIR